jgi:hypothetical protein
VCGRQQGAETPAAELEYQQYVKFTDSGETTTWTHAYC